MGKNDQVAYPICFPPPAVLFQEPNIACMTMREIESGSAQDAPSKATANCARGISSSIILTCFTEVAEGNCPRMVLPKGVYWKAVACKWSKMTSSVCPST
ncbi:putative mitochondrial-processing peptidase subunit beta [Senna tora]|uniref:Putative mitochondrial-processing peptidase subunit beta n=1 Tax=Senna tora TaxID=362788 RepID=A0A834XI63_9FABA|nr:putative mitochondrial-processing peptidase subunit beta [Senna tora]